MRLVLLLSICFALSTALSISVKNGTSAQAKLLQPDQMTNQWIQPGCRKDGQISCCLKSDGSAICLSEACGNFRCEGTDCGLISMTFMKNCKRSTAGKKWFQLDVLSTLQILAALLILAKSCRE